MASYSLLRLEHIASEASISRRMQKEQWFWRKNVRAFFILENFLNLAGCASQQVQLQIPKIIPPHLRRPKPVVKTFPMPTTESTIIPSNAQIQVCAIGFIRFEVNFSLLYCQKKLIISSIWTFISFGEREIPTSKLLSILGHHINAISDISICSSSNRQEGSYWG